MTPLLIAGLVVAAAWLALPPVIAVGEDDTKAAPPPPTRRPLVEQSPRDAQSGDEHDRDRYRGRYDRDRKVELTDEQVEKYMTVIRLHFPDFAERLDRLKEESPERFKASVEQMADRIKPMVEQMERDPEAFEQRVAMFKINGEVFRTARKLREAPEAEKPAIKAELRELVDKQFELRIKEAERDIAGLEKRIEQLRGEITERRDNRQKLVDERLEQIIASSDRFGDRERGEGDRRPGFDGPPRRGPSPGTPGTPGTPGAPGAPGDGPPPPRPGDGPPPPDDKPAP